MAAIDSVYNYYLSTYASRGTTRYDTHKKSELRRIYNSILKVNKESPLYKVTQDESVQKYAIDIKETARRMQNVIASLSDQNGSIKSAFERKVAISSQEDVVEASYIGAQTCTSDMDSFLVEVKALATPQTNFGNFLKDEGKDIRPGDYAFDLSTNASSYEFQYTVSDGDNNRVILDKVARLINNAGIGIDAQVVSDENQQSAIVLTSKQTGLSSSENYLFDINPNASAESMHAMDTLGMGHITTPAQNSSFTLNGVEHTSYSNMFTINNTFELILHGISEEGNPAVVGFKTNTDAIADNISNLVNAYNGFIQVGETKGENLLGNKLIADIRSVANGYRNALESCGLLLSENGSIYIERSLLDDAVEGENPEETFSELDSFKNSLRSKTNMISLDPMKYVDKTLITYKNPGKGFFAPYITSMYSGMMLDRIC